VGGMREHNREEEIVGEKGVGTKEKRGEEEGRGEKEVREKEGG
jgi:hypothetical protein